MSTGEEHPGDDAEVIAFQVARLRRHHGMSQTALAEAMRGAGKTHWRQNTVSRIESGKQGLTVSEVSALRTILGDVLAGTSFSEKARQIADAITERATATRLRNAEAALSTAQEFIEQALKEIQALRTANDDETSQELGPNGKSE